MKKPIFLLLWDSSAFVLFPAMESWPFSNSVKPRTILKIVVLPEPFFSDQSVNLSLADG